MVNSLPLGMAKLTMPVPRPPVLLTVTVTGALVAVIAVSANAPPRAAVSTAPDTAEPLRVATAVSVAPAMVAVTVSVAVRAPAVSVAGMSRRNFRLTQLDEPLPIVAFET